MPRFTFTRFLLRHARDPVSAVRLWLTAWRGLRARPDPVPFVARLRYGGRPLELYLRPGTTDVGTLAETFNGAVYGLSLSPPVRTIVDLGANIGMASVFFALRYPDAVIHAFEPIPENFAVLRRNVEANRFASIRTFPYGWLDRSERLGLSTYQAGDFWSFSVAVKRGETAREAECRRACEVWDEMGWGEVDLMKIDIEGSEFRVFEDLRPRIGSIRAIVGELHGDAGDPGQIIRMLESTHRVVAPQQGAARTFAFKAWRFDCVPREFA